MPAVTVVLITYNRRAMLEEAIASVIAQSFTDWELIVVDDASTDDTRRLLESLENGQVRWVSQRHNSGLPAARNRGIREADSSLVVFLDDDDLLRPRALEHLVGHAQRNDGVIGVIGGARAFDPFGNRRKITHVLVTRRREIWPDILLGWVAVIGSSILRKDALLAIGGFDEGVYPGEDVEMFLRLGTQGPFLLTPEVVVSIRNHPEQVRIEGGAKVYAEFKRRFIMSLHGVQRERASSLNETFAVWRAAEMEYERGDHRAALQGFMETARSKDLWRSPIRRAYLVKDIAKVTVFALTATILGDRRGQSLRSVFQHASRKILKRHPTVERKKVVP